MPTANDYTFKYDKRGVKNPAEKVRPGEPWFFLRAQDRVSSYAISAYADALKRESDKAYEQGNKVLGDDLLKQALGCLGVVRGFVDWQLDNPMLVKYPD